MKGYLPGLNQAILISQFQPSGINAIISTQQQQFFPKNLTRYPIFAEYEQSGHGKESFLLPDLEINGLSIIFRSGATKSMILRMI